MNLKQVLNDLSKYNRSKDYLLSLYVNDRLNKSLQTYYKKIEECYNSLKYKNNIKIIKYLNKE